MSKPSACLTSFQMRVEMCQSPSIRKLFGPRPSAVSHLAPLYKHTCTHWTCANEQQHAKKKQQRANYFGSMLLCMGLLETQNCCSDSLMFVMHVVSDQVHVKHESTLYRVQLSVPCLTGSLLPNPPALRYHVPASSIARRVTAGTHIVRPDFEHAAFPYRRHTIRRYKLQQLEHHESLLLGGRVDDDAKQHSKQDYSRQQQLFDA